MRRLTYLDGLRGLAAMQVVAQHYTQAFAPVWTYKLGFLANGQYAVHVFFLMSGLVLTGSFERAPFDIAINVLRRVIRLSGPAFMATAIAGGIALIAGGVFSQAAKVSRSGLVVHPHMHNFVFDLSQILCLTGYKETTLFRRMPFLPSIMNSVNTPIWTLHVEFWGSIWILALVALRARSQLVYLVVLALSVPVMGTTPLALFTIGHLAALAMRRDRKILSVPSWVITLSASALLAFGLLLCSASALHLRIVQNGALIPSGLRNFDWFDQQIEVGAVAIFLGLLAAPWLQRLLSMAVPQFLGRISFSIYLIHWPIMLSLGSFTYLQAHSALRPLSAAGVAFIVGMAVSIPVAILFERFVDQPMVSVARRIARAGRLQKGIAPPEQRGADADLIDSTERA
jgi:peptidoglycan/LPS O-acetylase OafA/YrhL